MFSFVYSDEVLFVWFKNLVWMSLTYLKTICNILCLAKKCNIRHVENKQTFCFLSSGVTSSRNKKRLEVVCFSGYLLCFYKSFQWVLLLQFCLQCLLALFSYKDLIYSWYHIITTFSISNKNDTFKLFEKSGLRDKLHNCIFSESHAKISNTVVTCIWRLL